MAKTFLVLLCSIPLAAFADVIGYGGSSAPAYSSSYFGGGQSDEIKEACEQSKHARIVLAALYGSCEAPAAAKGGGVPADSLCQSMPSRNPGSLAQQWAKPSECPKSGSKPEYSQKGGRLEIKGNEVSFPNNETDCSGFRTALNAVDGLRWEPGKDITGPSTTAEMVKFISNPNSCWKEVDGEVLPGDMCVYNDGSDAKSESGNNVSGHVFTIDRISSGGNGSCEFSIIESSGGKDPEYGGPRVVVKGGEGGGAAVSDRMGRAMKGMSKSCVAKEGKGVKVARFQKNKAGCQGPKKKFKGEDCVKKCDNLGVGEV
jgi:hypothetical protein